MVVVSLAIPIILYKLQQCATVNSEEKVIIGKSGQGVLVDYEPLSTLIKIKIVDLSKEMPK